MNEFKPESPKQNKGNTKRNIIIAGAVTGVCALALGAFLLGRGSTQDVNNSTKANDSTEQVDTNKDAFTEASGKEADASTKTEAPKSSQMPIFFSMDKNSMVEGPDITFEADYNNLNVLFFNNSEGLTDTNLSRMDSYTNEPEDA